MGQAAEEFVGRVRVYMNEGKDMDAAIDLAIENSCIGHQSLSEAMKLLKPNGFGNS